VAPLLLTVLLVTFAVRVVVELARGGDDDTGTADGS
jgi:hypothetical protein